MKKKILSLMLLVLLFGLMTSKTSGSPNFVIEKISKDFSDLMGGTSGGVSVTIKNTGDSAGSVDLYVDCTDSNIYIQPSHVKGIILNSGEEKTFDFSVSASNVDTEATITFVLQDYLANILDKESLQISVYTRKGIVKISEAYFEPGRVCPPAETDLVVKLSSSAQQKVTLVLSDYDKNIFTFDVEAQTVNLPVTNDYSVKFHTKVKPFTDTTDVRVTLYDDHGTRLGEHIATLYYDKNASPEQQITFDWNIIGYSLLVVVIVVLFISTIYFWWKSRR
jgi:hypothetical protein